MKVSDALLVTDIQNDFLPGGSLAVDHGDEVIGPLNKAIGLFVSHGLPVLASADWHPPDHCSFKTQGGPWPVHCVQDSPGAAFSPLLRLPPGATVVHKAFRRDTEAYSAFQDTPLARELALNGVRRIFIGGLTTEYCILNTAEDALKNHYEVYVLKDAVRAIDAAKGKQALDQLARDGARLISTGDLPL